MSDDQSNSQDWQAWWDARKAALESLLGEADDNILTSMMPIYMGGKSDVMIFRNFVQGLTYVTAGLTGYSSQKENQLGQYELMMCTREEDENVSSLLSDLSNYTLENPINPYDSIDLGPEQPEGITIRALLAQQPDAASKPFDLFGQRCGLLLLMGITSEELEAFRNGEEVRVLEALSAISPYTDMGRASVI